MAPAASAPADETQARSPVPPPLPSHHGMMSRIRNYFLTGLVLVGPLFITANLTWWFINWVDDLVRPFIPAARPTCRCIFRAPASSSRSSR
jgi:hypothetical protein